MPDELRKRLSAPQLFNKNLILLKGPREYVATILKSIFYDKLQDVYVVGDYTCETFLLHVGTPRMCIIDGNIMRKPHKSEHMLNYFEYVARCCNPRGSISVDCMTVIRDSMERPKSLVIVDGEEDLLALALQTTLLRGYVVYGLPNEGVAIADVTHSNIEAINIFSEFQLYETYSFCVERTKTYGKL
ncbi:MAG: DUF359 domain-containing protein [Ignisphaera sp.]